MGMNVRVYISEDQEDLVQANWPMCPRKDEKILVYGELYRVVSVVGGS